MSKKIILMDIIEVKNLTKKFKGRLAVDDISFEVKKGEIFGFLGPNGAGKSTTINMLSTIISPTSGDANLDGFNIMYGQQTKSANALALFFRTLRLMTA